MTDRPPNEKPTSRTYAGPVRMALVAMLLTGLSVMADAGVYLDNEAFLAQTFANAPPPPQKIWLDSELQAAAARILGHPYNALRVRYWQKNGRCAFILDEIGKEKPITVGIVIEAGKIRSVTILAFRESRGYEVKTPAFTQQFTGASLRAEERLDRSIDGITGATMSVNAVSAVSRLALFLSRQTQDSP